MFLQSNAEVNYAVCRFISTKKKKKIFFSRYFSKLNSYTGTGTDTGAQSIWDMMLSVHLNKCAKRFACRLKLKCVYNNEFKFKKKKKIRKTTPHIQSISTNFLFYSHSFIRSFFLFCLIFVHAQDVCTILLKVPSSSSSIVIIRISHFIFT